MYEPRITGLADKALIGDLEALSRLFTLRDKPPDTLAGLRQRAEDDLTRLLPAVQGAGYWAAGLAYTVDATKTPVVVTITVTPGPLYHLKSVSFTTPKGGKPPPLADNAPKAFGLEIGGPARTAPVLAAEGAIAAAYANEGRLYAKVVSRKVVIDRATDTMDVTYVIDAGPKVRFGPARIEGLSRTDPAYAERRIKWRRGAVYDAREVAKTNKALLDTGLFSTVRIDPATAPNAAGEVPMTITLTERVRHSVGAGLDYDTSEGFGANAMWEYRNIFGAGESLGLSTELAQQRLAGLARFRKPDFLATDQDLVIEAELADEMPDPYEARRIRLFTGLDRHFTPELSGGVGLQGEKANVTQNALFDAVPAHVQYALLGVPIFARRDTTDDLLNPTRGNRESVTVTPYTHLSGPDLNFVALQGKASGYQKLAADDRLVAAGFVTLGSILGESVEDLPADKRLYAGGGGSVRGYGYQRAGPLASNNLPIGGVSSLVLGAELRIKVTETIGVVPFFDAGNVYRTSLPDPGKGLFYGPGIGARYYTPIGPVRLDVAFPLHKRPSDGSFQVYISIGQAF
ncbi:MAG TPA: BamA/TamA family outer membrane protein [Alphaproteobacteria bacterium]|nr:BamA/TamA family outer membrane protein [Alphaproteobacteria bacterium]